MECTFKVGDKVVCVRPVDDLKIDAVYTITRIGTVEGDCFVGVDRSFFEGLSFLADRFRPIATRSTDKGMSILRGLLDKADQPVKVTA